MNRKFNKVKTPLDLDRFNLLYLTSYIESKVTPADFVHYKTGVNLGGIPFNVWKSLSTLFRINKTQIEQMEESCIYKDPIMGNTYYGAYPVAYLSKKFPKLAEPQDEYEKFIVDEIQDSYRREDFTGKGILWENDITRVMLGHGWDETQIEKLIAPELKFFIVSLNKKEIFIFKVWCDLK